MMRPPGKPSILLLVLALGAALSASGSSHEEATPWDQASVTALAQDLVKGVDGLRSAARAEPPMNVASGQARSRHRLNDTLRVIENEARHLAASLEGGAGRDETLPVVERIEELRRVAADDARRIFMTQDLLKKITDARGALEQLRPYYGLPPLPPAIQQ